MEKNATFRSKLAEGQIVEKAITKWLQKLLPEYTIKNTEQDFGCSDRDEYCLCDVVVLKGNKPVLGIEAKRSETKFRLCDIINGWDGDYNTPLNSTSISKYKKSNFPFYILNINQFCHKAFIANISDIMKSRRDKGQRKPSGVIIYNYDSSTWKTYEGDFKLTTILKEILLLEGIC